MVNCQHSDGVCTQCGVAMLPGERRRCRPDRPARPKMNVSAVDGRPLVNARPLLGDRVEATLKKLGVTPERYAAAKELFGLPPSCGCEARMEWLNKVSRWWRGR